MGPFKEVKLKKSKGQLYDYFPAILIKIGLFRPPGPILGSLFLPMMILTLMQVLVCLSSGSQNEKLMNCSVLLLACLSFQQLFRQQIPLLPEKTLGDELVYSFFIMTIFTAIDAFLEGNEGDGALSYLLRTILLVAASLYPVVAYGKVITYYMMYRRQFA